MGSAGRSKAKIWFRPTSLFLLTIFLIIFSHHDARGVVRGEFLHLEINPEKRAIRGTFQVRIVNSSLTGMGRQEFFLYPGMFTVNFLRDNFEKVIEGRKIKPGEFRVLNVWDKDGRKVAFRKEEGSLGVMVLDPHLQPGEERTFKFSYEITIPNHFSCFSSVRGGIYVNGAFYPLPVTDNEGKRSLHLEDEKMNVEAVLINSGKKVLLFPHRNGYVLGDVNNHRVSFLADPREMGLFLADYETFQLGAGESKVTLFLEKISKRQRKKIEDTLRRVYYFLKERHPDLLKDLENLVIIEAPLRKRVSFFTSYGVIVSDRIFDSVYLFQSQHQEALIESIFSYLASRRSGDNRLISRNSSEFVGEIITNEFRIFTDLKLRDLRKTLKPVTFIPFFDRVYYERKLPFARSYIRTVYRFGFPGEDFPTTEYRRITGDSIFRVIDAYSPDLDSDAILREYLQGRDLFEILSRWDLDDDFLMLIQSDPRSDYRVERVEKRDGLNEITLVNLRENAPREMVRVLVELDDGTEKELQWDTKDREIVLAVESSPDVRVKNVTVDPAIVMEDIDRSNNYLKKPMRVLLQSASLNIDSNTGDVSAGALINFRRAYDDRDSYFLSLQTSEDSNSARFDYRRALKLRRFGGLFWQGGMRISREKTLPPSEESVLEGILALDYSSSGFPFLPLRDIRALGSFTAGMYGRGGRNTFYGLEGRVVKYFQMDLRNTLALKIDGGIVWGDLFDERLLQLGGRNHIRGIKDGEAEVENLLVGTVEFRHRLSNDMNFDLPWGLLTIHGFAVNLFLDGGTGDLPSPAQGVRDSFRASAGIGLFWIGNILGIAEVNLNFEFARELDRFIDNSTLFYFRVSQSF